MTIHNIIGSERAGPHFVVRRFKPVRRRTFADVFLSAVGGLTLLAGGMAILWRVMV